MEHEEQRARGSGSTAARGPWAARALLGLLAGLVGALLAARGRGLDGRPGPPELWVLDAGARELVAVDGLGRLTREPVVASAAGPSGPPPRLDGSGATWSVGPAPGMPGCSSVRLVPAPGAAPAATLPRAGGPLAAHGAWLDPHGTSSASDGGAARLLGGRALGLHVGSDGALVQLAGAGGERLVHVARRDLAADRWLWPLRGPPGSPPGGPGRGPGSAPAGAVGAGAVVLARDQRGRFLVAEEDGELRLFERGATSVLRARRRIPGRPVALAAGPDGGWWLLRGPSSTLVLLDAQLGIRVEAPAGLAAAHLASVPGAPWAWVVGERGARARRFGSGGEVLADSGPLPLQEVRLAAALASGALWIADPGSLVRLAPDGSASLTQGGFERIVALAAAEPPP